MAARAFAQDLAIDMPPLAAEDIVWNSYFSVRYGTRMQFTKHRSLPWPVFESIAAEISQSPHTSEDSKIVVHCLVFGRYLPSTLDRRSPPVTFYS